MNKKILDNFLKDNDQQISTVILSYLKTCQKCYKEVDELYNVISFGNGKRHYKFKDVPGVDLELKKFCNRCCESKASSVSIYVEI
mgnify:CR=1 FL=1